jgi:hypothetical protein
MAYLYAFLSIPDIINATCIQKLTEVYRTSVQSVVGIYKEISILILYCVSSRLVTLLKFIYASVYIADIFVLIFLSSSLAFFFRYSLFYS